MANEYLDKIGLAYFWGKLKAYFQEKLVSGTNIKTVNNESLLGSGNITIEGGGSIPYLTCADEATTVAKTTTLVSGTLPPTLEVGQQIAVKFTSWNNTVDPTLEVGTYGAIPMMRYGTTAVGTSASTSWASGSVCIFVYDGANWILLSDENTTYSTVKYGSSGLVPAPGTGNTNVVLRKTTSTGTPAWGKVTTSMLSSASATPTSNYVAQFDSTAHMNSTDMTETEVDDFVDSLDGQGSGLEIVRQTFTKTLSTSTWYGATTVDITKSGYKPISVIASVNQVRYHCQVSAFTDTSVTVNVADYSSTGMNVTVTVIVTYINL